MKVGGIAIATVVAVAIGFAGWFAFLLVRHQDVERGRFPNPHASIEAVVVERLMNATAPDFTLVYIVASKSKPRGDPLISWAFADGLKIAWSSEDTVVIHADSARVYGQKDFNRVDEVLVGGETVHIHYEITNIERR
jgi:hypothetical protein